MRLRRNRRFYQILALCLGAVACSPSLFWNYGRITPEPEVTKAFESYQVNPEFRYYMSGSDFKPATLMGLHRAHRLDPSTTWREVNMSAARMREIVEGMTGRALEHRVSLQGFEMSDKDGRPMGVWYSTLEARTFIRMNDDGTVWIDTPGL